MLWSREAAAASIGSAGITNEPPDMVFYRQAPPHRVPQPVRPGLHPGVDASARTAARAQRPAVRGRVPRRTRRRSGTVDLVENFSVKLPLATICELLGLPASDWAKVHSWTDLRNMSTDADPIVRRELSLELRGYLDDLIERSQTCPVDGPYDVVGRIGARRAAGLPDDPAAAARLLLPADLGRERDHPQRHHRRRGRAAGEPRPAPAADRRSVAGRHGGRRGPALDLAGDPVRPGRHRRCRAGRPDHPQRRLGWAVVPVGQP